MDLPLVNYDGGITTAPKKVVFAESVADIQAVLSNVKDYPSPVRAMGSYHSLTPCASSDGTVVKLSRMNRILAIDTKTMTMTAQAGIEFIDASKALRAQNLQFVTNIEIGNMTLGAAACCHTKDGLDGFPLGQVSSYVTEIKWVTPDGKLAQASETSDPEFLRRVRSSYASAASFTKQRSASSPCRRCNSDICHAPSTHSRSRRWIGSSTRRKALSAGPLAEPHTFKLGRVPPPPAFWGPHLPRADACCGTTSWPGLVEVSIAMCLADR